MAASEMMKNERLRARLAEIAGADAVLADEPMRDHTTFRIGGPADFFVSPAGREAVTSVLAFCRQEGLPWFIMGNGSNLLVSDSGFRGVVIHLGRAFARVSREGNTIFAEAGALLSQIASEAAEHALAGFEFAAGIPGTLGGACMMNAGAYGGEMKQVLSEVTVLTKEGGLRVLKRGEMGLGYRTSAFLAQEMIVLDAVLELQPGSRPEIEATMRDLRQRRADKQPLDLPSAGSTFKRPLGHFAGKLIMDSGLAGYAVGGARVSEKHCGFVVNTGGATAEDVRRLIGDVKARVLERFGVELEPEIRFLGEFAR